MKDTKKVKFDVKELETIDEFHLRLVDKKSLGIAGFLYEVVSREPRHLEEYFIGDLKEVTYKSETPVKKYQNYIFKPGSVEFPEYQPPVLRGKARKYNACKNRLGLRRRKMVLYMKKTPKEKEKIDFHCL